MEEYHRIPQILTLFQTKKCHFHTRFLPGLKHSYPFSDLPKQKLCHHSYLDQNANRKILKSHFEFASALSVSFSFGFETTNTFIHSCTSLESHTPFQTKMGKIFARFQTVTAQKTYLLVRHKPIWPI